MDTIIKLLKQRAIENKEEHPEVNKDQIERIKEIISVKAKSFLQRLIDNGHIEKISTEAKAWPTVNDYIKYIAITEDPMETLLKMIK